MEIKTTAGNKLSYVIGVQVGVLADHLASGFREFKAVEFRSPLQRIQLNVVANLKNEIRDKYRR